ncbi:DUF4304 domain-containing protein [Chitinophaga silvatica]|uniref:DUF4304 domain-containing protein n=1 Tax=Chitinophaga silvatica TaxID=2282649 RepID=A0A3E1YFS8_9BACT|nr:DUF4304 domain-containing protein [Chitinophaga silvatica]RFS26229.1 DUF4304 domain-containing protein [Chitinophaga silvatica]
MASDKFKLLLSNVSQTLKEAGYKKKGNSFYSNQKNNWGIINFQKSKSSNEDTLKFTINYGVCSSVLRKVVDYNTSNEKLDVADCHWQARIGTLMPGAPDFWWTTSDKQLNQTVDEVITALKNNVLPEINKRISDKDLIEVWMSDQYPGTTELNRFRYLITLLKEANDSRLIPFINNFITSLQGKPLEKMAIAHLKEFDLYAK